MFRKKIIVLFLLLSNLKAFSIPNDKKQHFSYCFYISSISSFFYKNYLTKKYKYKYRFVSDNSNNYNFNFYVIKKEEEKKKKLVYKPFLLNNEFNKQQFLLSFGTAFTIGILKEFSDKNKKGDYFSKGDLVADALGAMLGSLFTIYLKF